MKHIITDFYGIFADASYARVINLYAAARSLKEPENHSIKTIMKMIGEKWWGAAPEIRRLCDGDIKGVKAVEDICKQAKEGSLKAVHAHYFRRPVASPGNNAKSGDATISSHASLECLAERVELLRDVVTVDYSLPIKDNLLFFAAAKANSLCVSVLSDARESDVSDFLKVHLTNEIGLANIISTRGLFYAQMAPEKKQGRIYQDCSIFKTAAGYAVLCDRLKIFPWEVLALVSSKEGVDAANLVGIPCICVAQGNALTEYSHAPLVIGKRLYHLASHECMKWIKERDPRWVIRKISSCLADSKVPMAMRKDYLDNRYTLEQVAALPVEWTSWVYDPEIEDSVAEDFTTYQRADEVFYIEDLKEIMRTLCQEGIEEMLPEKIIIYGGKSKSSCRISAAYPNNLQEKGGKVICIYERQDTYNCIIGNKALAGRW